MTTTVNDVRRVSKRSPWRVLIKSMDANRGPGTLLATLCDADSVGGSKFYNGAGEAHFTLPNDSPDLALIEPRKVHYVIQQATSTHPEAWRDVFEGLVIDKDATDDETVFYGIDYMGLLNSILDERFDFNNQDEPPPLGSKYVDKTIGEIVADQLQRAIALVDSPLGFVTMGTIDSMPEKVTLWSTMKTTLEMCVGLIDSHRQGTGKRTRLQVLNTGGVFTFEVDDNPGVNLANLRFGYGELVQGYNVVPFGPNWSSMVHGIGRTREGLKLYYDTEQAPGIDPAEWGRFAKAEIFLDIFDESDLKRRTKQAAWDAGLIGQKVGLGYRMNALRPLDGYDILDRVPVEIIHGGIDTRDYLPWWCILGVVWEGSSDGKTDLVLTLSPQTTLTFPDPADAVSKPYPPWGGGNGNGTPDGLGHNHLLGEHAHAIREPLIGDGVTTIFYPANEFEPDTMEASWNGVSVDVTEGAYYDSIEFSVAPVGPEIRLDYLARLGTHDV